MNEETLELEIKAKASEATKSLDKLISLLTNVDKNINKIFTSLNKVNTSNEKIDDTVNKVDKIKDKSNNATKSIHKLGKALTLGTAYVSIKKFTIQFLDWMDMVIDRTEQLNLFNVVFENISKNGVKTFSELGKEAIRFQNKLNEAFGTNLTETLKYQGLFQSMAKNVGIPDLHSSIMSTTMTKLTYDLASLYNKSESVVAESLRAGVYAGQTKPLRGYGIDVTQTSMTPILYELGITDRTIKQMSQAEKEILRYLATLKQAKVAMGDFANTIESPANQLKVFKQQLVESKVALTNLFMGTFANILPYANALLMVVKEVAEAIAIMLGIELTDYNSGIASTEDAYIDLGDSIDNATASAKELKRQILGFDQIHNINEDKDKGNGNGLVTGIDQRLLDAIKGYDNGMDRVRMKATEIRDRIMEWLGFTKTIDTLTGEVNFKLKDGYSNLKLIGGVVATLLGMRLLKGIYGLISGTSLLGKTLGTGGLYTALKKLISPITILGAKDGLHYIFLTAKDSLIKFLPVATKVVGVVGGLVGVFVGSKSIYNSIKKVNKEVEKSDKEFKEYTKGLATTVAGATTLGLTLGGPLGGAIGALTGLLWSGVVAWEGYKQRIENIAKENLFGNLTISIEEWGNILLQNGLQITDYGYKLTELKEKFTDYNSAFMESSEALDLYGYKFGILGQKITEEDSVKIIDAINNMATQSNLIIEESTNYSLQLWGETFSNMSTLTEEEERNILNSIVNYGQNQKDEIANAQENITKTYDHAIKTRGYLTDEEYNYISEQLKKIKKLTQTEMSKSQAEIEYLKAQFADTNLRLDEESYSNFQTALSDYQKEQLEKIKENYRIRLQEAEFYRSQEGFDEKKYQDMKKTAYEESVKEQNELANKILEIQEDVYGALDERMGELLDDTTEVAFKEREIIENIFKNANIDSSDLKSKFKNVAKACSDAFKNEMKKKITINGNIIVGFNTQYGNTFANGGILKNGKWQKITQYANGGLPSVGEMFIARESGPELVGKIGNNTAIMNNMQIVDSVRAGVYEAVSMAMNQQNGQISKIDVHVHTDEGVVVDRINQKTIQTGVCPINIPA